MARQKAAVDSGQRFLSASSGRWAGERMLRALQNGGKISPAVLRTADTLRKDEWKHFDEALVQEGTLRLRGVADLMAAGLTRPVANGMGKTIFEYEEITDMEPAITSLDGLARSEDDRQEFNLKSIPLPITHKDFNINLRTLSASRERGESLDTTQVRTAGRLVAERLELMLFQGGPTYGGLPIYGYATHPNRNLANFTAGTWDTPAVTGENILTDVLAMITALEGDRFNSGPYWIYVPSEMSAKLEEDFKANSDKTIRQRVMEVDRVAGLKVCDQMPTGHVIMVQATSDVVVLIEGEPLQTVQWDVLGGFQVQFKAFTIAIPLVRSAPNHTTPASPFCGVVDMTAAP